MDRQLYSDSVSVFSSAILHRELNSTSLSVLPFDVDKWFRDLISQNRTSRANVENVNQDLLQALLSTAAKLNLTDEEVSAHALSVFVNGFDTSSTTLSFLFFELARNPHIQERVHEEINAVNKRHGNLFHLNALQEMEYLEMVLQGSLNDSHHFSRSVLIDWIVFFPESQRLNPILAQFTKLCTKEYTLPPIGDQKTGVKISPGTTVVIPVRGIHL